MRKRLTDRTIEAIKPATKRYLIYDSMVPNLAVRVSKRKAFVIVGRFNGSAHPTRHSLGSCVSMTLDEAREKARNYQRQRKGADTFGEVAESFFEHARGQRKAYEVERCVRRDLIPRWESKPIASIAKRDVIDAIDVVVRRGSPSAAHHVLAYARRVFNFAIARDMIEHSPCDRISATALIGRKGTRERVLTDAEIVALWRATARLAYPYGPLYRLLLVTGQRKSEVAGARWNEIAATGVWTIPPERFKSNATHIVPLSQLALGILSELPREGDRLFGLVNGFSKNKRRLDKAMGDVEPFVIHDIRRTVRTRLSALRVPYEVAEMVIGHGKRGLARVYDQHRYLPEMRDALDAWAQLLERIVTAA